MNKNLICNNRPALRYKRALYLSFVAIGKY